MLKCCKNCPDKVEHYECRIGCDEYTIDSFLEYINRSEQRKEKNIELGLMEANRNKVLKAMKRRDTNERWMKWA